MVFHDLTGARSDAEVINWEPKGVVQVDAVKDPEVEMRVDQRQL